jgi:hypothetical protein
MNKEELRKELIEISNDAYGYLKEYIKNNEESIKSIKEFDNCISAESDMYIVRVYDLAQMQMAERLLSRLKE